MYNNNIPRNYKNVQRLNYNQNHNNDRFFGGFAVPFVLGGITGSLLTPRYNNYPIYAPYPYYQPYYYPYRPY